MAAKNTKPAWEQKMMSNSWLLFGLAIVFLAIAYGFASLAINFGSFWQYALAIIFIVWGLKELKRGIQALRSK